VCDAFDITEQQTGLCLHADGFRAWDGQHIGVALFLQPPSQVRAVAVDRISDHPANGQLGCLGTLHHQLGQFRFGGEGNMVRDMSGLLAWQIGTPVFGQVQLAVDEGVSCGRHVGEEDTDLAIFDTTSEPAVLGCDARGVTPAFGKATFVNDKHREGRLM
jgi:hypothetical protein